MEVDTTKGTFSDYSKQQHRLPSISSTILIFVCFYFGMKLCWNFVNKIKCLDLKMISKCGKGIFCGSPQDIMEFVLEVAKNYDSVPHTFYIGHVRYVVLCRPQDLEVVLNSSYCLEKSYVYRFFTNAVGEGLFSAPVEKWKKHRRLITPVFNMRFLEGFFSIFNDNNNNLLEKLEKEADTGEYFDLWNYISPNSLEIICQTAMGCNINSMESSKLEFDEALRRVSIEDCKRIYKPWLHPDFAFNLYAKFTGFNKHINALKKLPDQIIKQRQKEFREKKQKLPNDVNKEKYLSSFLDLLLQLNEEGAQFSNTDIRDEVITMMIGGSETSAVTISFTMLMLAIHPEIQEKLYEEVKTVLGDSENPIELQDVNKMVYMEQCIKETLRLFPTGAIILRRATKNVALKDGFVIDAGVNIVISTIKLHRYSGCYKNPLLWNPDNFSAEGIAKRHKFSFLGFSGGPRGCIGYRYAILSMKVTLSMILRKYILISDMKLEDIKLEIDLLMRSADGYKIKMYSRNKK